MSAVSEEEQLAQIKEWWQRNGLPLLLGVVIALALVVGWQAWQKYRDNQAQQASALYQELLTEVFATGAVDTAKVARLANDLKKNFGGKPYAQYGQLFLAKVAVDEGRLEEAAGELRNVLASPANETLGELARQRLAQVLGAQDKPQQGIELLQGKGPAAFLASREELKGDLLLQLGQREEAHAAYLRAKQALAPDAAVGALQVKIDDLAQGDA